MLRRRWPLLLVLLALAGCGWAAWRIHAVGRPIEEAYARIQVGMPLSDAHALLANRGELNLPPIPSIGPITQTTTVWWFKSDYVVTVIGKDETGSTQRVVKEKRIKRPDWTARFKLAFGIY